MRIAELLLTRVYYIILYCNGYNCIMLYKVKCICIVNPISCICLWNTELLL
jgi:hypothetical protein